jgi:hypothetical protein
MIEIWDELMTMVENVVLRDETDALVWCYNSVRVYSSQSMYGTNDYRGDSSVCFNSLEGKCPPPPQI